MVMITSFRSLSCNPCDLTGASYVTQIKSESSTAILTIPVFIFMHQFAASMLDYFHKQLTLTLSQHLLPVANDCASRSRPETVALDTSIAASLNSATRNCWTPHAPPMSAATFAAIKLLDRAFM